MKAVISTTNVNSISGLTGTAFGMVAYASALSCTQGIPDAQAFNMIGFPSYLRLSSSESAMVTGAALTQAFAKYGWTPMDYRAFGGCGSVKKHYEQDCSICSSLRVELIEYVLTFIRALERWGTFN